MEEIEAKTVEGLRGSTRRIILRRNVASVPSDAGLKKQTYVILPKWGTDKRDMSIFDLTGKVVIVTGAGREKRRAMVKC